MRPQLLLCLALASLDISAPATAQRSDFVAEHDVAVPMRDGVVLRANVWRPRGEGPFPVLVYRTPYGKDRAVAAYSLFRKAVARGYAVVAQDVRGRYASEGEFEPYRNEGRDGYDTIEWAARQPWSNGSVGTFGLSYPGAVQWLAAVEGPPHLKAMVPAMTFASPRLFFYAGGVWDGSWITWIWHNIAPDVRVRKKLPGPKTADDAAARWDSVKSSLRGRLPLAEMAELRESAPWYYEWMRHPAHDPWWDWAELRGKYGRTRAAVLNLSGWHDESYGPDGSTKNFAGLVEARRGERSPRAAMLVGPWPHGVAGIARTKVGEREMGSVAALDYDEIVLRWMDHWVRGIDNGVDREPPVRVFVMGANRWREANAWPLPGTRPTSFYLSGVARAGQPGGLRPTAPSLRGESSAFVSDPANPVTDPYDGRAGAHDYRELVARPDVLTFDTPPLERDVEVVGRITAEVFLSTDAPDTDLWVRLYDVAPDGTAYNLMSPGLDVVRASYRHAAPGDSAGRRELLEPGRVYKLTLPHLVTGNLFRRGHRIRVQISAAFFPHYSRNLHTGELEFSSSAMRTATLRVHHDASNPSRIVLPVVEDEGGTRKEE